MGDLLHLSKVPSTAPEFPLGTQSEPTDLSRAPLDAFKMGVKIVDFRTILEPKVTRSRQSGALRGPRHPQGVPRTAQELPFGTQSGPRDPSRVLKGPPTVPLGRHWPPFGRLWGRFGWLLGSFWTSLGVYVATFRVKRLNHGKPRILLEKRSSGAHGGG